MHQSKGHEPIFFVVFEPGAPWPRDLSTRGLTEVCVVVQHADECAATLAGRLYDRLARVHQSGGRIAVAALVLNGCFSYADLSRRRTVARLLTSTLLPSQPAELVVSARNAKPEWEAHLIALSHALSAEVPSSVELSLELGDFAGALAHRSHDSGVCARVGLAPAREQDVG
jgi:hypothetical protein